MFHRRAIVLKIKCPFHHHQRVRSRGNLIIIEIPCSINHIFSIFIFYQNYLNICYPMNFILCALFD